MTEAILKCIHKDLELVKNDLTVIKRILYDEGELSDNAKTRLANARKIPQSKYTKL